MKETLQRIILDFHERAFPHIIKRELELPVGSGKIITVIGPRRSGKSFCLLQTIEKLLTKGLKKEQIVYLNFEDERLDIAVHQLDDILKAYRELYPHQKLENCYFFFDEIQNVAGWDKFVRRCYDTISLNIFLSGSNAVLLSSEIASSLRGRTVTYEMLPLSFKEYLNFRNIAYKKKNHDTHAKIANAFKRYLIDGGYPEVVLDERGLNSRILQDYFVLTIYRDIVLRYGHTNLPVVKYFLKRLADATCSNISLHKIYKDLRSEGYKLDKNLLYALNESAKTVYLSMPIKRFDYSEMKSAKTDSKGYFIDNGLLNAISFKFDHDLGHLLENALYLYYRGKSSKLFYYKSFKECDFVVVPDKSKTPLPVQVTYNMRDAQTREREISGLLHCCKSLNVKKGLIITMDEETSFTKDKIKIEVRKAVTLLLE